MLFDLCGKHFLNGVVCHNVVIRLPQLSVKALTLRLFKEKKRESISLDLLQDNWDKL